MLTNFFRKEFTLDRTVRCLFVIAVVALAMYIVGSLKVILWPFVLAWITAAVLMPLVHYFERKWHIRQRGWSVTLVVLLFLLIVGGFLAFVIPSVINEVSKGWSLISRYTDAEVLLAMVPEQYRTDVANTLNLDMWLQHFEIKEILDYLMQAVSTGWDMLSSAMGVVSGLTVVFLFVMYLFFILLDYEVLIHGLYHLFPHKVRHYAMEAGEVINVYVNSYIRGQGLIALIIAAYLAVGFGLMGMPMGITLGLLIGILNFVPYLQIVGYPPLILCCALQSVATGQNFWVVLLIAVAIMMISEVLQDFVLRPLIMQKSLGMRASIIILSLAVWGFLLGAIGIFFALPFTMVIYYFYMKYVVGEPIPLYALKEEKLTKKEEKAQKKAQERFESERSDRLLRMNKEGRNPVVVTTQEDIDESSTTEER